MSLEKRRSNEGQKKPLELGSEMGERAQRKAQRAAEKAAERLERRAERAQGETERGQKRVDRKEKNQDKKRKEELEGIIRRAKKESKNMTPEERIALHESLKVWEREGMSNDSGYYAHHLDNDDLSNEAKKSIMAIMFESGRLDVREAAALYAEGGVVYPGDDFESREGVLALVDKYLGTEAAVNALLGAAYPELWPEGKLEGIAIRIQDKSWAAEQLAQLGFVDEALDIFDDVFEDPSISDGDVELAVGAMIASTNQEVRAKGVNTGVSIGLITKHEVSSSTKLSVFKMAEDYLGQQEMQKFLKNAYEEGQIDNKQYNQAENMIASLHREDAPILASANTSDYRKKKKAS